MIGIVLYVLRIFPLERWDVPIFQGYSTSSAFGHVENHYSIIRNAVNSDFLSAIDRVPDSLSLIT